MRLTAINVISSIWGHSSVGRAPAWHEGHHSSVIGWYETV
ncbi:Hypothetical protein NATL1_16771 [Prochlorococcus marinus str. NATL1A]|uniref:Uncharacterized protein n=1 Tax=Prochlorococcus marinus (strain NATL1A) TaxID=167555 RepID=A2C423_PROM1|nr:Hypothetical protein NATL1_16771 [Prochlorococcus marinus str. NATL1A]